MTPWMRLTLAAVVSAHAALHLLGAAKGLGWAPVRQLTHPIGVPAGWAWLAATVGLGVAAAGLVAGARWWWTVGALAAVASQAVILSSWQDAKAGTAINFVLLAAAVLGYLAHGPGSFDARWQDRASAALAKAPTAQPLVAGSDLAGLPDALAGYLRQAGVLGRPVPHSLYVTFEGRIRSGPDQSWMPFTGRQVSSFGSAPSRLFLMHATRGGLPVTVLHEYGDATATMRGKVLSAVTVLDASGPEMDRGETVTVFNDMVVLAPAALLKADVTWSEISAREVRGDFTSGKHTVSATLIFDEDDQLSDFVSDDRSRATADGKGFTPQRWSTPITSWTPCGGRNLAATGAAQWHAPAPEGLFTYVEMTFTGISYDRPTTEHAPCRPATA